MYHPGRGQGWGGGESLARLAAEGHPADEAMRGMRGTHMVVLPDRPPYVELLTKVARDGVAPVDSKTVAGLFKVSSIKALHDSGVLFAAHDRRLGHSIIGINPLFKEVTGLDVNVELKVPEPSKVEPGCGRGSKVRPRFFFHIF